MVPHAGFVHKIPWRENGKADESLDIVVNAMCLVAQVNL
jgi:hypothetical protein